MKTHPWTVLALGVFASFAFACSSSSPPPVPDGTVTEFCDDWATAYCQLSSSCEFDPNECATYQRGVCNAFAVAAQAGGTRMYNQPNGKACIAAITSAFAGSPPSVAAATPMSLDDTCNMAFIGAQASDQSCVSSYDCADGLVCALILGTTNSVCATVTDKSLGQICGDPGDECQGDSYCAPVANAAPACVSTPLTGGACSDTVPCGSEDYCVSGACAARATIGQWCSSNDDCASSAPYCDTYPPAACTNGLTFARGSTDCNGIAGTDTADAAAPMTNDADVGG